MPSPAALILAINIVGGLLIGVFQFDMPLADAAKRFTILTIGDGLVTAIPSLLISVAGGIITTRAAAESNLGESVIATVVPQSDARRDRLRLPVLLRTHPRTSRHPLLPSVGGLMGVVALRTKKQRDIEQVWSWTRRKRTRPRRTEPKERIERLLKVDPLGLEVGYA